MSQGDRLMNGGLAGISHDLDSRLEDQVRSLESENKSLRALLVAREGDRDRKRILDLENQVRCLENQVTGLEQKNARLEEKNAELSMRAASLSGLTQPPQKSLFELAHPNYRAQFGTYDAVLLRFISAMAEALMRGDKPSSSEPFLTATIVNLLGVLRGD